MVLGPVCSTERDPPEHVFGNPANGWPGVVVQNMKQIVGSSILVLQSDLFIPGLEVTNGPVFKVTLTGTPKEAGEFN